MATGLENLCVYQPATELELKVFELTKHFPNLLELLSGYIGFIRNSESTNVRTKKPVN